MACRSELDSPNYGKSLQLWQFAAVHSSTHARSLRCDPFTSVSYSRLCCTAPLMLAALGSGVGRVAQQSIWHTSQIPRVELVTATAS